MNASSTTGLVAVFLVVSLKFPFDVHAWEKDVHYGLTGWLAVEAGYPPPEALALARAADFADKECSAVALMAWHICVRAQDDASAHIRKHHFPHAGQLPGKPHTREVYPEKDTDFSSPDPVFVDYCPAMPNLPSELSFGLELHPFQDSWSHQGVPDVPHVWLLDLCPPGVSWSHPKSRDGWFSHNADLTYLHSEEVMEMARRTFEILHEARHGGQPDPSRWQRLAPLVHGFASADTKEKKRSWFKARSNAPFSNLKFLDGISLPDTDYSSLSGLNAIASSGTWKNYPVSEPVKAESTDKINGFLRTWIVERRIEDLANRERIDFTALESNYIEESPIYSTEQVIRIMLGVWLIKDHGWVNKQGHAAPGSENFGRLDEAMKVITFEKAQGELGDYIAPPLLDEEFQPSGAPYLAAWLPERERMAVVFRFKHAPNDNLLLLFDRYGNQLKGFAWFAR